MADDPCSFDGAERAVMRAIKANGGYPNGFAVEKGKGSAATKRLVARGLVYVVSGPRSVGVYLTAGGADCLATTPKSASVVHMGAVYRTSIFR